MRSGVLAGWVSDANRLRPEERRLQRHDGPFRQSVLAHRLPGAVDGESGMGSGHGAADGTVARPAPRPTAPPPPAAARAPPPGPAAPGAAAAPAAGAKDHAGIEGA